jgi:hypothetical protein
MQLAALQRALSAHVLSQGREIADWVVGDAILDATSRLAVYRDGYAIRLTEALDANFPMLHRLLGDEEFSRLARFYLEAHPSRHRSIRWLGAELAHFLASHMLYAKQPALAELAEWEWAMTLVFDARDATPVEREALQAFRPDEFGSLQFQFHPSLQRLQLSWNAPAIWQALQHDSTPPAPVSATETKPWIIWRQDLASYYRSLDAAEHTALALALAGAPFGGICEQVAMQAGDADPALLAAGYLDTWLSGGLLIRLSPAK